MSAALPNCSFRAEDANDDMRLFTNIVDGPVTLTVIILGSIGNIHCVLVVYSRQLNRAMAANLAALAFWDLLLLICAFGYYSLEASVRLAGVNVHFEHITVTLHGLVALANSSSVCSLQY
uniref:G-protein coupled receptors family 1 profile domain-containing protein n=1 Tax=Plectus sambesii TaxID=2011161 RepID=A0A914UJA4_9BILA